MTQETPGVRDDAAAGQGGDMTADGTAEPARVARVGGREEASSQDPASGPAVPVAGESARTSASDPARADSDGGARSDDRAIDAQPASDPRLAGTLSTSIDGAATRGGEPPLREAARLVASQVGRWIEEAASGHPAGRISVLSAQLREDGGEVRLQLHPPHLGELRLQLSAEGARLVVHVTVQQQEAGQLLRQHTNLLEQALERAGLQLAGFSVEVGHHPAGGHPGAPAWAAFPAATGFAARGDARTSASVAVAQKRPLWVRLGLAAVDVRV